MDCKIGTVREIKGNRAVVYIERHSACSECHAKGACTSADRDSQLIEVEEYPLGISEGSQVRIVAVEGGSPLKAVLFVFVIPIILIAIGAMIMNIMEVSESRMLLILFIGLLAYGGVLWLLRGYFERTFRLRAELIDGIDKNQ